MNQNKKDYINLCENEQSIPIFMQNWWLDAVCTVEARNPDEIGKGGLAWDVALARDKNGNIVAALTYAMRKKSFIKIITVPHLTKFTGIWQRPLPYPLQLENSLEEQNRINTLIIQLPDNHRLTFQLNTNLLDWSPFYWAGFKQTTRYVQVLEDLKDKALLYKNLNRNTKRNIKKAEEHFKIEVHEDFATFFKLNNIVFKRQKMSNTIPAATWQRVEAVLKEKKQRRIYFAFDENGEAHGTFYMVWDNNTAYALANGLTGTGRTFGAMAQLTWQAISDASEMGLSFNFLGSMLPSVALFNQGFNTVKKPYFVLTKSKNMLFDWMFKLMGK